MDSKIRRLIMGNRHYMNASDAHRREETATQGQHPYAIVITCSDSRVIPEVIFSTTLGDLFVIRVAGNVLGEHVLASVDYAVHHLGCKLIVMLGHTGCGAIAATLSGEVNSITEAIRSAIGNETDAGKACRLNVGRGVRKIRALYAEADVRGAVYDILSGRVEWLEALPE